ncbi:MAG TPA: hypothetical protein DCQ04_16520 [Actinobacteria bacterium]|nr:hypothetical protein [Actinomycetota bacterium]
MLPSVYRPVKGRLLVRLPYLPDGGNYALLHEFCGQRTTVSFNNTKQAFEVAAPHLQEIVTGCLDHFGEIDLTTEHYAQQTCVEKCWMANPNTALSCVCGCAGLNHGTKAPFDRLILDGTVSVQGEYLVRSVRLRR